MLSAIYVWQQCGVSQDLIAVAAALIFTSTRVLSARSAPFDLSLRSGHTERGLPQRTAVSVRCGMLHSKQTLLTIIF